jgi:hypothetical protein
MAKFKVAAKVADSAAYVPKVGLNVHVRDHRYLMIEGCIDLSLDRGVSSTGKTLVVTHERINADGLATLNLLVYKPLPK